MMKKKKSILSASSEKFISKSVYSIVRIENRTQIHWMQNYVVFESDVKLKRKKEKNESQRFTMKVHHFC